MNDKPRVSSSAVRRTTAWVFAFALLAACGGGNGDGTGAVNNPSSPGSQAPDDCRAVSGIEGGGRQRMSGVVSAVETGGHVVVSNVRFAAAGAKVYIDGDSASIAGLRAGDAVTVTGEFDLSTQSGCAAGVFADADITAEIDEMDLAVGRLELLGQEVRVYPGTVLADDVLVDGQANLQPGDRIRVTGLYADDVVTATRIDRAAGQEGYFVAGVVTHLDGVAATFRINEITVHYGEAALVDFPAGQPREGDAVRLAGMAFAAGSSSSTGATVLQPTRVEYVDYGTPLAIFPASASLEVGGSTRFIVSSGTDAVTWSVSHGDGRACTPSECGVIDSTGTFTAPMVEQVTPGLLVTATSVADPSNTASGIVLVHALPFPVSGPHTLRGEVFSFETGMIGNANVNLWVQQESGGYSYWWANGPLNADGMGLFEAPNLPDSHVSVNAWAGGYVQPCAVTSNVSGDVSVRVEMMSTSAFDADSAPRPQLAVEPSVSGVIYETTADGRQPVAGAMVWLEETVGITYATTISDRSGGYFVCNIGSLPTAAWLTVVKDGFETLSVGPVNSPDTEVLDIELKRL